VKPQRENKQNILCAKGLNLELKEVNILKYICEKGEICKSATKQASPPPANDD